MYKICILYATYFQAVLGILTMLLGATTNTNPFLESSWLCIKKKWSLEGTYCHKECYCVFAGILHFLYIIIFPIITIIILFIMQHANFYAIYHLWLSRIIRSLIIFCYLYFSSRLFWPYHQNQMWYLPTGL